MHCKVPKLTERIFPARAERWRRVASLEAAERAFHGPVSASCYRIPAGVPAASGRRIAFFSDLHWMDTEAVRRVVKAASGIIRDFKPHYLLFGGDVSSVASEMKTLPDALAQFPDVPVKLAVPGNWERSKLWLELDFWRELFAAGGFRLLVNEFFIDDALAIYGLDDSKGGFPTFAGDWPAERFRLMLAHNPDSAVAADGFGTVSGSQLVLCGHTHGGQIRLPWLGPLLTSSHYGCHFDAGLLANSQTGAQMLITSGLGQYSFPWRFRCPREVMLITLV